MNCQDIAHILDDGDTRRLDTGLRRTVEAHVAGCLECARDWHNHDHLTNRSLPAMPPALIARCRELTAFATPVGRSQRTGNRYIVVGALAALAAAAAMLVIGMRNAPEQLAAQPEVALQPAHAVEAEPAAAAAGPVVTDGEGENASAASGQAVAQPTPAPATFRVRVQLQNEATDTVAAAIIDSFHSALLEQLRTVPGLDLVTHDVTAAEPDDPATYQFLVLGSGPSQDNKFSATLMLDARKAASGGYLARYMFQLIGDIGIACHGWGSVDPPSCRDPVAAAADVVGGLRITQFPADPSLREQQQARLLDSSLDPVQRLKALADLVSPSSPGRGRQGPSLCTTPGSFAVPSSWRLPPLIPRIARRSGAQCAA